MGKPCKCKDHLGNNYESTTKMCDAYNISVETYISRIKNGLSVKEALTMDKTCKDHLENLYKNKAQMCKAYGISQTTYNYRIKRGLSVEEALTSKKRRGRERVPYKDHLGNEYSNLGELCATYGISNSAYRQRIRRGYSVEEALTLKNHSLRKKNYSLKGPCKDHLGNEYPSKTIMCEAYNVELYHFDKRIERGWTLQEALEGRFLVTDHKGNKFKSIKQMCDYHKTTEYAYFKRLKEGYSQEEALTMPLDMVTDHLGNKFKNITKMCKHYGIEPYIYSNRMRYGWTKERALTQEVIPKKRS